MKKFFITLLISLVLMPAMTQITEAQTKRTGRFYELITDHANTNWNSSKSTFIQWAKDNFDEYTIPLISTTRLTTSGQYFGLDSAFKYHPIASQTRFNQWSVYLPASWSNPLVVYNPHWMWNMMANNPSEYGGGLLRNFLAPGEDILSTVSNMIDDLEQNSPDATASMCSLNVVSRFENGSIKGTMHYNNTANVPFQNVFGSNPAVIQYQIILAEAYHKYGTEEHYFIPRSFAFTGSDASGIIINDGSSTFNLTGGMFRHLTSTANPTGQFTFSFPVDKSWNTKYLYVIAIAELVPYDNSQFVQKILFDAVVDAPVNVKSATSHTPIELEVDYADPMYKSQMVPAGADNVNIRFRITNPTAASVTAEVYIDENTSQLNNWSFTFSAANKQITVPAGGNVVLTLTGKAPGSAAVAAVDFCVRPINTEEDENPIISNILALAATDFTRLLVLTDKANSNSFLIPCAANQYIENISIIPSHFCSIVDVDMFDAYIFSDGFVSDYGRVTSSVSSTITTFHGNFRYGANSTDDFYTAAQELMVQDKYLMDITQVKFLNNVISKNKHLALFTAHSPYYSTLAPADIKSEYGVLFSNFGVSYKEEIKKIKKTGTNSEMNFGSEVIALKGIGGDALILNAAKQPIHITSNLASNVVNFPLYFTDWNITNTGKATKVMNYDDNLGSTAAVKVQNAAGTQKMFLAGFSLNGIQGVDLSAQVTDLFRNLTTWWFGAKDMISPNLEVASTDCYFKTIEIGKDKPDTMRIVVRNIATEQKDILKIYSASFSSNPDQSFTVIKELKSELKPGEEDVLIIEFDPKAELNYVEDYRILCNDPYKNTVNLKLYGKGFATAPLVPLLTNWQKDLYYNFTQYGTGGPGWDSLDPLAGIRTKEYNLYNIGALPVDIYSIELSPETDIDVFFLQGHTNIKKIDSKTDANFALRFRPYVKEGNFEGKIIIKSNCSDSPIIELEFSASVVNTIPEDIAKMFDCKISPNPASNDITIDFNVIGELSRNVTLNIIDNSGRLVKNVSSELCSPGNYIKTMNISDLSAGIYFIEYTVDGKKSASSINVVR